MRTIERMRVSRRPRARPWRARPACAALLAGIAALLGLTACGGAFMTSTPAYARYDSGMVFKEFKAKGLRVDSVRDMSSEIAGANVPRYREAKGFLCGANDGSTGTLFTFDSPDQLAAMAEYIKKKYSTNQRQIAAHNLLLVFWLPGKDDTLAYDSALLGLP